MHSVKGVVWVAMCGVLRMNLERCLLACAGNIRVFCRCRPLSQAEMAVNAASVIEFEAASNGDIVVRNGTAGKKLFKFDRVFSPQDDQSEQANLSSIVVNVVGNR